MTQPFDHLLMHMPHAVDFQHIYIENYMDSAIRPLAHAHATCRRLPAHLHRELHGLSHSTTCSCTCHMPSTSSTSTSRTTWTQPFDHLLMHMPHAVDFQHIYIENYMDSAIRPLAHAHATCRRLPAYLHRELHGLSPSTTCSCTCHMPYVPRCASETSGVGAIYVVCEVHLVALSRD